VDLITNSTLHFLLYGLVDVSVNIQVERPAEGKWKTSGNQMRAALMGKQRRMEKVCHKMTHPGGKISGW
jgi:hypothetical protein